MHRAWLSRIQSYIAVQILLKYNRLTDIIYISFHAVGAYICWSRMMIHWDLATGSSASIMTTLFPLITCRWLLVVSIWCYILLPMHSEVHVQKFQTTISKRKPTTIPISVLSFPLTSTVLSTTRFMNWSNPRSVPITTRFAFSLTGEMVKHEQISQWKSIIDGKI